MSKTVNFFKYQGTGNDFIMIDGRGANFQELTQNEIAFLCHRRFGIGGDGLIILRNKDGYDFDMDYHNSDGNRGSMCGNGGRCTVAFAYDLGIIKNRTTFFAPDGEHEAEFIDHNNIRLKMQDLKTIENHKLGPFMNTGSPHLIVFKNTNDEFDVYSEGKNIRYNDTYKKEGTNVNFVKINNNYIDVFTYERGVEDVTYSCGTGTVASAIAANIYNGFSSPVTAQTKGGILKVDFEKNGSESFSNIWLQGNGMKVFSGSVSF